MSPEPPDPDRSDPRRSQGEDGRDERDGGYPFLFRGGPPPEGLTDRLKDHVGTFIGILAEFLPGARRPPAPRPDPALEDPPSASAEGAAERVRHPRRAPDREEEDSKLPPILFPPDPEEGPSPHRPSSVRLFGETPVPDALERATLQMLPGRLEPLSPALAGQQVRFLKGPGKEQEVTIGRGPGELPSHVTLDHRSLREAHARMLHRDGQWFVTSSDAADPVLLNGEAVPVADPHLLEDGDLLRLGELEFRFRWP